MGERRRRRSGEDRISGLPDALLHEILVRLRSADAAARTSVLSRRWRHVWAHMPELRLVAPRRLSPASFFDAVDAALGGYLAPTLEHLGVSYSTDPHCLDRRIPPPRRIARWLHFAAEHVMGEVNLFMYCLAPEVRPEAEVVGEEAVLELPVCERTKRIELVLACAYNTLWLRPQHQASGLFTALKCLKIRGYVCMEGSDLTALVSTQCPCLTDLNLFIELVVDFDVLIHSNSLHTLELHVIGTRRLEVVAPRLEELTIHIQPMEAHISAPKLVKVAWHDAYDPHVHRFVDVGRTLRRLKTYSWVSSLTKRFDEVEELELTIDLHPPVMTDVASYGRFLNETNELPKCKSFCILLSIGHHAFLPVMLQLLRSCNGTQKLRVHLRGPCFEEVMHSCPPSCPCRSEESRKIDAIDLSSLEEVVISGLSASHAQMELQVLLHKWNLWSSYPAMPES